MNYDDNNGSHKEKSTSASEGRLRFEMIEIYHKPQLIGQWNDKEMRMRAPQSLNKTVKLRIVKRKKNRKINK